MSGPCQSLQAGSTAKVSAFVPSLRQRPRTALGRRRTTSNPLRMTRNDCLWVPVLRNLSQGDNQSCRRGAVEGCSSQGSSQDKKWPRRPWPSTGTCRAEGGWRGVQRGSQEIFKRTRNRLQWCKRMKPWTQVCTQAGPASGLKFSQGLEREGSPRSLPLSISLPLCLSLSLSLSVSLSVCLSL